MIRRQDSQPFRFGWRAFLAVVLIALTLPFGGVSASSLASDPVAPDYSRSAPLPGLTVATEPASVRGTVPRTDPHPASVGEPLPSAPRSRTFLVRLVRETPVHHRAGSVHGARGPPPVQD
ncbi:hypothetical protein GCM10009765_11620 [Fodinicola feengrottensis]|uniref:Secreted protein n=1 Tax=Fodinicola feengrottensis TaxID=435914 RepID=A0ABN2G1Q1_9ACTN